MQVWCPLVVWKRNVLNFETKDVKNETMYCAPVTIKKKKKNYILS